MNEVSIKINAKKIENQMVMNVLFWLMNSMHLKIRNEKNVHVENCEVKESAGSTHG